MSDPYRVLRKLGQGSMAEVLLAEMDVPATATSTSSRSAKRDVRRVAVKRVLPPLRKNPKVLALFKEEARLLSLLRHDNIPALLASRAAPALGEEPWLALEYVDGVDLAALLRAHKKLPVDVAVTIATDIARALAHAHALCDEKGAPMRVVHRDVTPSNVLLSVDGAVKLADFGVAKHDARPKMTRTGALVGKLTYMAPEQLRGAKVDARTDVFGWGVVAYEMLAGELPFDRDDDAAASLGSTTLTSLARRRRGLDGELVRLIERALELEPDKRPADGAALVKALPTSDDDANAHRAIAKLVSALAHSTGDGEETLVDGTITDRDESAPTVPNKRRNRSRDARSR